MSDRRKTKFMTLGFKIPFSIMTTNKSTAKILNTTYIYSIGRDNEKLCYPYWNRWETCHSPYAGIGEESLYRKRCISVGSVFPGGKNRSQVLKQQAGKTK